MPARVPAYSHEHHRDLQGGQARAAVFGISDGLVSNVALILGLAGGGASAGVVRLAGLAALVSGAVSMASGEWTSMKAQRELQEREIEAERRELARNPEGERRELVAIYRSRGVGAREAEQVAGELMQTPATALATHTREELGIDPDRLGSPAGAALWSFLSFALGALLPILPWIVGSGDGARVASLVVGVIAAATVGVVLARLAELSPVRVAARQAGVLVLACAATTLIGELVGVTV